MLSEARVLDAADPLRHLRNRFNLPDDVVYLDGNSLGALPRSTAEVMENAVAVQWGRDLIRSWNDNDWIGAPQRVGGRIAPLIGAAANEVIVADSVSVNIFKLLTAMVQNRPGCTRLLSEAGNFPTDVHIAQGVASAAGLQLELGSRDELVGMLNDQTAALLLTHVHYKSGQRFDMAAINAAAKALGVPVLWDLSHSAGAVLLDLGRDKTQFAVGCGYKFLNGGPGAPSFIYVAEEQQAQLRSALQGWMGHASPFAFDDQYEPAPGMDRFLVGTPPILSLLALECGVRMFEDIDMNAVWEKSKRLFDFFVAQMAEHCPQFQLVTPTDAHLRGSQTSFLHSSAWPINNALIARGVIGDFRTPDVLRFGLTPLYTRFEDIARAVEVLSDIMTTEEWQEPKYSRNSKVT
jgi:kynureninase